MQIEQLVWSIRDGWQASEKNGCLSKAQLVIYFGSSNALALHENYDYLRKRYPKAMVVGCSTAGEIMDEDLYEESIVVSAAHFDRTRVGVASLQLNGANSSFQAGAHLGFELNRPDLQGIILLADGMRVNGSDLVAGLVSVLGTGVPITGGLAADGRRFEISLVSCNRRPETGRIAAIAFYGKHISLGHGLVSGWDAFGPQHVITKSKGNTLFELDHKPALKLYKKHLGDQAANLPGSALLFPMLLRSQNHADPGAVRMILSVDEGAQSVELAGDAPEGRPVQLLQANFEGLIDGARAAANLANLRNGHAEKLAIIISCIGRKMVLGSRSAEEIAAVRRVLGNETLQFGFYAYGAFSPSPGPSGCELHNQTMTVTTLAET